MSRYKAGTVAVVVVMLSLVGTIALGVLLSVESQDHTVTKYRELSDVSGLFEYTDAPEFITYNPSSNYTGYRADSSTSYLSGITWTESSTVNSYAIPQQTIESSAINYTISSKPQVNPPVYTTDVHYYDAYEWGAFPNSGSISGIGDNMFRFNADGCARPNVTTLSSIVADMTGTYEYAMITVGAYYGRPVVIPSDYPLTQYQDTTWYTYIAYYNFDYNALPVYLKYTPSIQQVDAYDYSMNLLWTRAASNVNVLYGSNYYYAYDVFADDTNNFSIGNSLTYKTYTTPATRYMDISDGVTVPSSAYWSNGYYNQKISILFTGGTGTLTYTLPVYSPTGSYDANHIMQWDREDYDLQVVVQRTGTTSTLTVNTIISGNNYILGGAVLDHWNNFVLTLDMSNMTITQTPIYNYVNTQVYQTYPSVTVWDGGAPSKTLATTNLDIAASSGNSVKMQVISTDVFLNTYGAVMQNPSVNINDWFSYVNDPRLNFYSFALYGSAFTVNEKSFTVNSDHTTSFYVVHDPEAGTDKWTFSTTEGAVERTVTVSNFYVTWTDGRCYLHFVDDGLTVDMGSANTRTVAFTGTWYFTAALYEPYTATEHTYEVNWDDMISVDTDALIIVFLGLLIVGGIVAVRKFHVPVIDVVVLVGVGVLGFAMLGGMF